MANEEEIPLFENFMFNTHNFLHDNAYNFHSLLFLKVKAVIGKNDEAITDFETVRNLLVFMQQHVFLIVDTYSKISK